jgi:uncharacterized membrane protein YhaH (DUF805 family)|tara:strand:- start:48 stop:437 length:390 start_codon:yes stop_codon:yes gene_type:complete
MNFIESLITCYKKTFNYRGRASKSEYWWFKLYIILFVISLWYLGRFTGLPLDPYYLSDTQRILLIIPYILLFSLLPLLSAVIRRFHDTNKSGWAVIYAVIPFIGPIIVLIMLAVDGTKGKNTFGPKPKK